MLLSVIQLKQRVNLLLTKIRPAKFFVVTSFVFGILFISITPPFQTPDEPVHFYRAYQISKLNLVPDINQNNTVGGVLPKSLGDTVLLTAYSPTIQFSAGTKYNVLKTTQALTIVENEGDSVAYDFSATVLYSPVAYVPQAAGILVARILGLPPIAMMYAARLANLAAWILALYLAIKLMPHKKWAVVVVGLLPIAISQAGSLSTDVMATGSIIVFMALVFKHISQTQEISNGQLFRLSMIATVAILSKQVMFVFVLLLFLLPMKKLGERKTALLKIAVTWLIPLLALLIWSLIARSVDTNPAAINNQDPTQQIKFVLLNPHSFINVLWNTHFFTWGDGISSSMIGNFGWLDTPLSEPFIILGYLTLFLAMVANSNKKENTKAWLSYKQRSLLLLVATGYWLLTNAALYVFYNPVGYKIITGLQGRYFVPILILAIPIVYGTWLKVSDKGYTIIVTCFPILLLLASFITIYFRYYIENV